MRRKSPGRRKCRRCGGARNFRRDWRECQWQGPARYGILGPQQRIQPCVGQRVHVFLVNAWAGEPAESEEMRPQWFEKTKLPFAEMWPDDKFWLPKVLQGEKVAASFVFADDSAKISKYLVKTLTENTAA